MKTSVKYILSSFVIALMSLEASVVYASAQQHTSNQSLPDFNQLNNAQEVGLSIINNQKRSGAKYVAQNSIKNDHSLSNHTESYFYSDDVNVSENIVKQVIQNPTSSVDNTHNRPSFTLKKTFTQQEAQALLGKDFIGHDGRTRSDTNSVTVVINIDKLQKVKDKNLINQGVKWFGGDISTAFPEA